MSRRYLFLCPDSRGASGGIAVIYDTVVTLRKAGYDAFVVHNSPDAGYSEHLGAPPLLYTNAVSRLYRKYGGPRAKIKSVSRALRRPFGRKKLQPLTLRPQDSIIAPEFMMPEAMEAFPDHPLGVFVQNPFSFMQAHLRGMGRGFDIRARVHWFIGISEICEKAMDLIQVGRRFYMPVSMKPDEFPYRELKEAVITYMPRKRPWEAAIIAEALQRRGRVSDYQIRPLEGLPRNMISEQLQKSRFFISLLKDEALGFPAAEAMAAGCVTIGFTGLGTNEYFDTSTGIPVPEGDIFGLVEAVEAAVAEYEVDPTRLDAMRRYASERIHARYGRARFEEALLKIWAELDATPQASVP